MLKIKEPKYRNKEVLLYCLQKPPHGLLVDELFVNYDKKTVVDLCEDLEVNFDYFISIVKNEKDHHNLLKPIEIAQSLVWASLFYHHEEFIPKKYIQEDDQ